ncbi:MAG: CHAT domain-containing protein [Candidatus Saccharicenans sp.]|nr:CHAT domain-containing protein [Candidatus Saccharicenans sp.]
MRSFERSFLIFLLANLLCLHFWAQNKPEDIKYSSNFGQLLTDSQEYIKEGLYEPARFSLQRILKLARTAEEKKEVNLKLAEVEANLGNLSQAYSYYEQTVRFALETGDKKAEAFSQRSMEIIDLYNKAKKLRQEKHYDEVINTFNEAVSYCDEINNRILKVKALRQQGYAYLYLNESKHYLENNLRANEIAKAINNTIEVISTFTNIGHYYSLIDNINLAIENFDNAVLLSSKEGLPPEVIFDAYYNGGSIRLDIGQYDKAIEYLSIALELVSGDKSNPDYAACLINLGYVYVKRALTSGNNEDYDQAFQYFNQALSAAAQTGNEPFQVAVLNNIGSLKAHLEENLDALYYLNKSRILAEKIKLNAYLVSIYTNIGIIYARQGDYQNSSLYYDKAINLALSENEDRTLWESYLEKGNLLKKQGKLTEARFYYLNSINIIESLRSKLSMEEDKASFLGSDKRLNAYHNLIDLLINLNKEKGDQNYLTQAFSFVERAKSRAFLDSIESSNLEKEIPADPKLINQEKEIMSDMSKLYTKLIAPDLPEDERTTILQEVKSLEDKLDNIKRQIRSQSPAYANLTYPEIITYEQASKEFAKSKTAVFTFVVGEDSAYGFALTGQGLKVYPIPARSDLRLRVINHRKAISDTDNSDFQSGRLLYDLLLKPGMVEGIKNLIIIPDDILNLLPFETLLTGSQPDDWLIKNYTVYYAPSLSSLRELANHQNRKNRAKPQHNLLAVGDPYYGELEDKYQELSTKAIFKDFYALTDLKFYRLRYSHEEIKRISSLIPKSTLLEREKASEDLVKSANLSDYKIIHFAAHGLIDDQKPARSAIILTLDNDPAQDGFLQMREVFNLRLNADLVVLSSCQTGLGQFVKGEGIEGISRAFFYAGSSSVVMSLWTINDQVSSQFMERFYYHLKNSEDLAQAIRQAKLEMIESGVVSHPYYWAGFILSGDGSTRVFRPAFNKTLIALVMTFTGLALTAFIFRKKVFSLKKTR